LTGSDGFQALPRHLLGSAIEQGDMDAFARSPFWTRDYIGLGPYRIAQWQPGSSLEYVAFDQHVLGRPRIGRVKIIFVGDTNAALANLLAGSVDFVGDSAIGLEQALTLQDEWERGGAGTVFYRASQWRYTAFQLRPELASPQAMLDPRVRKALAYAVDRQALNDSIYHGQMAVSDFLISPQSQWGPAVAAAAATYPYDLQRSAQLMAEAGFTRGADGMYESAVEGRFNAEVKTADSPNWDAEAIAMAATWRAAGFGVQEAVLPAALSTDPEARVTFPGMFTSTTSQGEQTLSAFTIAQIPRAENRWRGGSNRGGWPSPVYDRLLDEFTTSLDPATRAAQLAQMAGVFTDDLPAISLLFEAQPYATVAALHGVLPVGPDGDITWNAYEWAFR